MKACYKCLTSAVTAHAVYTGTLFDVRFNLCDKPKCEEGLREELNVGLKFEVCTEDRRVFAEPPSLRIVR